MRNPDPIYNLNDASLDLEIIIDRLTAEDEGLIIPTAIKQSRTIIIHLGEIPENQSIHRNMARYATEAWAELLGFEVKETDNKEEAHITFYLASSQSELLSGATGLAGGDKITVAEDVDAARFRNHMIEVYLHEVGHILGLVHPHVYRTEEGKFLDGEFLDSDSHLISVMSYADEYGNQTIPAAEGKNLTPAFADIQAIQLRFSDVLDEQVAVRDGDSFYGYDPDVEQKVNAGEALDYKTLIWYWFTHDGEDDLLNRPRITLYDTGGIDTLDFSNEGQDGTGLIYALSGEIITSIFNEHGEEIPIITSQVVNLNPGWTSNVYGRQANLVIANGTIIENYIAGYGDDEITGNVANNRLEGRNGNDTLIGGPGDDQLIGGPDNDILEGGPGADRLIGNDGADTASYANAPTAVVIRLHNEHLAGGDTTGDSFPNRVEMRWTDPDGTEHTESLPDVENVTGSAFNDTLAGDRRDNVLKGNAGNDTLYGGPGGGDDALHGGPGMDRLFGGQGNDILEGGNDADQLSGGPGSDTVSYADSPEAVTVRLHNDQAMGGDALGDTFPNRVEVSWTDTDGLGRSESLPDIENLIGSPFDDTLAGDRRDNRLEGGAGNDTLYGGPGGGDDIMNGNAGDDRLFGGQGNDKLYGSEGNDRLAGGPGEDIFVFEPGNYENTITDFTLGEDKIDLTAFNLENTEDLVLLTADNVVLLDSFLLDGVSVILENLTGSNISEEHFIV